MGFCQHRYTEKIVALNDASPNKIQVNAMGRAKLVKGINGMGVDLNGHDQWFEVYRDDALGKGEKNSPSHYGFIPGR